MTETQQALEQKYMEFQMVMQQLERVREQLHKTDERIAEVGFVIESLKNFSTVEVGSEILIPVSNGVFAKAKITDTSKLLVNVGADTVTEKTVTDSLDMLAQQKQRIEEFRMRLSDVVQRLYEKSEELKSELQHMQV